MAFGSEINFLQKLETRLKISFEAIKAESISRWSILDEA